MSAKENAYGVNWSRYATRMNNARRGGTLMEPQNGNQTEKGNAVRTRCCLFIPFLPPVKKKREKGGISRAARYGNRWHSSCMCQNGVFRVPKLRGVLQFEPVSDRTPAGGDRNGPPPASVRHDCPGSHTLAARSRPAGAGSARSASAVPPDCACRHCSAEATRAFRQSSKSSTSAVRVSRPRRTTISPAAAS